MDVPTCYPNRHEKHVRHFDRTMQDVYETSQQKIQRLKEQGYTVVQMWECEWKRLKDTNLGYPIVCGPPSIQRTP